MRKTFSILPCLAMCLLLFPFQNIVAQAPQITRIDGVGAGNNFLEITDQTVEKILDGSFNGEIVYRANQGPIIVKNMPQSTMTLGEYEVTLFDANMANDTLEPEIYYKLTYLPTGAEVISDFTIEDMPTQSFSDYGLELTLNQTLEPGDLGPNNGAIGVAIQYDDPNGVEWFRGIPDQPDGHLDYIDEDHFSDPNQDLSQMGDGWFVPYRLCEYRPNPAPNNYSYGYLSPVWRSNGSLVGGGNSLKGVEGLLKLNNVDIVFTSNKDLWSRCVVIETADADYYGYLNLDTEGDAEKVDNRARPSVSKEDADGDGLADPDADPRLGMGWFPGYAIDVETGKRLNIFFGENSTYSLDLNQSDLDKYGIEPSDFKDETPTGRDLMWNPTDEFFVDAGDSTGYPFQYYLGGQHFIYISTTEYDECAFIHDRLSSSSNLKKVKPLKEITWVSMPMLTLGNSLLSYADGLIPNDLKIQLRVDNPYQVETGTGEFNGYPTYRFNIENPLSSNEPEAMETLRLEPNLYNAGIGNNAVYLKNLPQKATISLFSGNGFLLSQFENDSAWKIDMDISPFLPKSLSAGIYFVKVQGVKGGIKTLKLIVF